MNLLKLAWRSVYERFSASVLSVLLMAFGVSMIGMIIQGQSQLVRIASGQTAGIDLVVGAKGSPLQIVLCNVFHVDFPTGNISIREAHQLSKHRLIASAIPLSLGDSYRGFRIVGTNADFFTHYFGESAVGKYDLQPEGVWIGAEVAALTGLVMGDVVVSEHGLSAGGESHEHPLTIMGILPTTGKVIDRLIITGLEEIWHMHHSEEELHEHDAAEYISAFGINLDPHAYESQQITSLLIRYRSPMGAVQLPRFINENTAMQAASPAFEMARLTTLLSPAVKVVSALAIFIVLMAAFSVWLSLVSSLKDRKYELAILRILGASRFKIAGIIMLEGLMVSVVGIVLGLVIIHTALWSLTGLDALSGIDPLFWSVAEFWLIPSGLLVGFLAALWPAIAVYQTDISTTLSKG